MAYSGDYEWKNKNTINRWRLKGWGKTCEWSFHCSQESIDLSEQETQLLDSPDYSYLLMGDLSSRPSSEEPIGISSPSNYSPSTNKNMGQPLFVLQGLSETPREELPEGMHNTRPSTSSCPNGTSYGANPVSVTGDLSGSIRSLLQKIRGTCLEGLLQKLSSSVSASTQQHAASAHRIEQESISKERLVQILEETCRSRPNLHIRKQPEPASSSGSGHTAVSSESSILAKPGGGRSVMY